MDAAQFGEYLHLIGFKPTRCDLTALKTLLTRHMAALPFQTLSTVLGEPVPIDSGSIFRKLRCAAAWWLLLRIEPAAA